MNKCNKPRTKAVTLRIGILIFMTSLFLCDLDWHSSKLTVRSPVVHCPEVLFLQRELATLHSRLTTNHCLLTPQRLHRIDLGCPVCRNPAGQQRNEDEQQRYDESGQGIGHCDAIKLFDHLCLP